MAQYLGDKLISSGRGPQGRPGANGNYGSDKGCITINIEPEQFTLDGEDWVRVITASEHGMGVSAAVSAEVKERDGNKLVKVDTYMEFDNDGTITIKSAYAWQGICMVSGGTAQSMDTQARLDIVQMQTQISDINNAIGGMATMLASLVEGVA